MAVLEQLSDSVRGVADSVGPAVVGLGRGWGRGSCVVVAPGTVLTNAHNVRGDELTVTFAHVLREQGTSVGVDVDGDVAAISVETCYVLLVTTGDRATLGIGSVVVALANPGGRGLR